MLLPWNNLEILKQPLELWPRRVVEDDGANNGGWLFHSAGSLTWIHVALQKEHWSLTESLVVRNQFWNGLCGMLPEDV